MTRWYNLALRLTADSPHAKHKMAAVLVRGGVVLSLYTNGGRQGQHAEVRVARHPQARGATVYIARQGGRMSKPCAGCMEAMRNAGVARVVYANWDGCLECGGVS